MQTWPEPSVPHVAGSPAPLNLYDTADETIKPVDVSNEPVGMYVCGITPYDSTHLGHAATYLTFDLVYRILLANGHKVHYVQNITDVDDPLFERAERDGVSWQELGEDQINLFRSDMDVLDVLPPQHYVSVTESVDEVIELVQQLLDRGAAYHLDHGDIYASIDATPQFGYESNYTRPQMDKAFAERGGDPERPGKRHPLDALVWKGHREGEPSWDSPFGPGRPGWHVECSAIATNRLGNQFAIQGGGSDLAFPHHEFSAAHAEAAKGVDRMAGHYVHSGMIGLDGVKMSKSLGNLVFVHKLTEAGHEAGAIRLAVFNGHYRSDRDFSDEILAAAEQRLAQWRDNLAHQSTRKEAEAIVVKLRAALSDDLDAPRALRIIDDARGDHGRIIADAITGLLGVRI
ncbi:cysteine--1-D-myo-inosityl 2-amino-2-deoxy-alpha-D-glucopyranoside ligase [Corynebacterium cystitidis]|uniref:L-cysteine:1D-myo-inositol 2-amino-2-deoxy-alpha-D-glucopyranoside ligase n=1 Tax=Corynebacterium cystitidis DSM 20524 TaxID=1121357 RepID=A0A1H9PN13_9CORY|nr:cysteine--1-D-myo-inosityl 2-amino-2-deoxy-alpha-D-glucopyranoside ligase [Corynebacterium cystitidis]WJY82436.1 L-cysteine:1D-myo-inositol 2-amino-2-deoxy-alpha-D-glucopyranoside ligase [Corynebacterium cystitidis DSM 20524]SER49651.1 cysteinyl-tRNA synthetase [Corynebacterium cystitidis DSM 20524]SNV75660.1 cysteinyl-tRNA synthetase [Corynebacterium cystitidis]